MTPIRKLLAATVVATAGLITAGSAVSWATAAETTDTTTTSAPPAGGHGWHHHGPRGGWLYHKLGLTDAQKAQIKSIHEAAAPQIKSLFQQMQANSAPLKQLQPSDPSYLATAQTVSEKNEPLRTQLAVQQATIRQQIYTKVLTAAQQTELQQLEAKMQARHAGART